MECYGCGKPTVVYQTLTMDKDVDLRCIVRMRRCKKCNRRWKTEEVVVGEVVDGKVVYLDHDDEMFPDVNGEPWYMDGAFIRRYEQEDEQEEASG